MQLLIIAACAAVGVLLYMFLCLIYWDLFRYLPMPWGPFCSTPDQQKWGKSRMKFFFFLAGAAATLTLWNVRPCTEETNLLEVALFGFSIPLTVAFLLRILVTVFFGVVSLYQRSELVYESIKARVRVQLRKRGRIE